MKISEVAKEQAREEKAGGPNAQASRAPQPRREMGAGLDDEWSTVRKAGKLAGPGGAPSLNRLGSGGGTTRETPPRASPSTATGGSFAALQRSHVPRSSQDGNPRSGAPKPEKVAKEKAAKPEKKIRKDTPETKDEFKETLTKTLKELAASHDVDEAVLCIQDFGLPKTMQADMVLEIVARICEEREATRKAQIPLVAKLFSANVFDASSLEPGLELFFELYEDMKVDLPKLGEIVCSELLPALEPFLSDAAAWRARAT